MSNLEDYEAIISAELDTLPQPTRAPHCKVVVVLYDINRPLALTNTLLHRIDSIGHVIVAPHHPDFPITPTHGFSARAWFYPTSRAYSHIPSQALTEALDHAYHYSGRRDIYKFIIIDNADALGISQLATTLGDRILRSQLNASFGVTIEAYRDNTTDRYYHIADRYERILEQLSPLWTITHINGIATSTNTLDAADITVAGYHRRTFADQFVHTDPAGTLFLRNRGYLMQNVWQPNTRIAFLGAERMFLTFGTVGRNWDRL